MNPWLIFASGALAMLFVQAAASVAFFAWLVWRAGPDPDERPTVLSRHDHLVIKTDEGKDAA